MDLAEYDAYIERMRETEYPMLKNSLYLDHAGTTLYSKTSMERFHGDMMANLYGNPHSASPSSQRSTQDIESVRLQALQYFDADPEHFDLVFTANTTAAIKLVMEAFRVQESGFWYGYHVDSHTSLVGVRESAKQHRCFESDYEVESWIDNGLDPTASDLRLFAYPAQSNMNGRRLPMNWTGRCKDQQNGHRTYTLLDAAAYAATSPLRMTDPESAPDFTVLSFSKIFGFPDLGALIVKKDTSHLFARRGYFGGGTVDMVVSVKEQWHALKSGSVHECLEDGTLPVHSILALNIALQSHEALFLSLEKVAEHTTALADHLYGSLVAMRHMNGQPVCKIYKDAQSAYGCRTSQGPTVAFNLQDSHCRWISNAEVEKLASIKDIHLRTGGLCNPGGVATALNLAPWEMLENFSAGFRCGNDNDILNGKPTGVIRVSLGAMSCRRDVDRFLDFVEEFFMDKTPLLSGGPSSLATAEDARASRFYVERLSVYPIKSCGGWQIPYDQAWDIRPEGLAWDREWCIVKQGTGAALSQKAHPRMALIRPHLDFKNGVLRIRTVGDVDELTVPLSKDPSHFAMTDLTSCNASVCGDSIRARRYTSKAIADFFTKVIGVPCTLARFPPSDRLSPSTRHSKAHLQKAGQMKDKPRPILLSNESPILTISRSSLNRLNETIKAKGGKAAHPNVFRANIVLAENQSLAPGQEQPWAEDEWEGMTIGGQHGLQFDFLGGCRRCQMVCVDQDSGEKNQEPFVTLAKTRRFNGRVLFGVHTSLAEDGGECMSIMAGDVVQVW